MWGINCTAQLSGTELRSGYNPEVGAWALRRSDLSAIRSRYRTGIVPIYLDKVPIPIYLDMYQKMHRTKKQKGSGDGHSAGARSTVHSDLACAELC